MRKWRSIKQSDIIREVASIQRFSERKLVKHCQYKRLKFLKPRWKILYIY